jgi:hypothetical protein
VVERLGVIVILMVKMKVDLGLVMIVGEMYHE